MTSQYDPRNFPKQGNSQKHYEEQVPEFLKHVGDLINKATKDKEFIEDLLFKLRDSWIYGGFMAELIRRGTFVYAKKPETLQMWADEYIESMENWKLSCNGNYREENQRAKERFHRGISLAQQIEMDGHSIKLDLSRDTNRER